MTDYNNIISSVLRPRKSKGVKVLDLFAGCGGLSLGFEASGFETIGYEMSPEAAKTYNRNLLGRCINQRLDSNTSFPNADIVVAGPPCQPYSVAGSQKGARDSRNGFPVFLNAVGSVRPKVFVFENVRGMVYKNKDYFNSVIAQLKDLGYCTNIKIINAKDFFVPQNRERVFVVGILDSKISFKFPETSYRRVSVKNAIRKVRSSIPKDTIVLNARMDEYILKYEKASKCINPRDLDFDKPSRTLTCRNLSGNTGDMIRLKLNNGFRRTLSVKEAALLQSFPTWFRFYGKKSGKLKQIGNAVPPMMSYSIAQSIGSQVFNYRNAKGIKGLQIV